MKLDRLTTDPGVSGIDGARPHGANAFASSTPMDVQMLGLHRALTKRANTMGLELALMNHQRDSTRRILDSFK